MLIVVVALVGVVILFGLALAVKIVKRYERGVVSGWDALAHPPS